MFLSDGQQLREDNIRELSGESSPTVALNETYATPLTVIGAQDQSIFVFNRDYLDLEIDEVMSMIGVRDGEGLLPNDTLQGECKRHKVPVSGQRYCSRRLHIFSSYLPDPTRPSTTCAAASFLRLRTPPANSQPTRRYVCRVIGVDPLFELAPFSASNRQLQSRYAHPHSGRRLVSAKRERERRTPKPSEAAREHRLRPRCDFPAQRPSVLPRRRVCQVCWRQRVSGGYSEQGQRGRRRSEDQDAWRVCFACKDEVGRRRVSPRARSVDAPHFYNRH